VAKIYQECRVVTLFDRVRYSLQVSRIAMVEVGRDPITNGT
jgi:hypothetical protein